MHRQEQAGNLPGRMLIIGGCSTFVPAIAGGMLPSVPWLSVIINGLPGSGNSCSVRLSETIPWNKRGMHRRAGEPAFPTSAHKHRGEVQGAGIRPFHR